MNAIRQDRVIAGGPEDFMEVRHLVLTGTNEEIGRALATLAIDRFGLEPAASTDRLRTRVQRRYIEMNYPILYDRMRGVAAAFGKRLDDDDWNFSGLDYLLGPPPGCSVVYYPPGVTGEGIGVVSRNYDYGTGTGLDEWPEPGELPVNSRPYLVEMHPDRGYASLALCAFDLLSGVMDGINSAGLTVTYRPTTNSNPSTRETAQKTAASGWTSVRCFGCSWTPAPASRKPRRPSSSPSSTTCSNRAIT